MDEHIARLSGGRPPILDESSDESAAGSEAPRTPKEFRFLKVLDWQREQAGPDRAWPLAVHKRIAEISRAHDHVLDFRLSKIWQPDPLRPVVRWAPRDLMADVMAGNATDLTEAHLRTLQGPQEPVG